MPNDFYGNMLAANIPSMMGSVYYVDPANGLDSYDGKLPARAFKTLIAGENALVANNNDMLVLIGNQTPVTKLTATLLWNKNYTHLVGACSPVGISQRARIFGDTGNTSITPLIDIVASGCSFRNILVNYGIDDAGCKVAVRVAGNRNYFENVHFAGIGNATQNVSEACSLLLDGCTENLFKHCSIGLDTQSTRGSANSEIYVINSASKQFFEDCYIYAFHNSANHSLWRSKNAALSATGTWMFKNCLFHSMFLNNATAMLEAFVIGASMGTGYIILDHCVGVHITAWSGSHGKVYIAGMPIDSNTDGIAINL